MSRIFADSKSNLSSCYSRRASPEHDSRPKPNPSEVLGVFGLSLRTTEEDLRELFNKYAPVRDVTIIYDLKTGYSRRFGFAYFNSVDDATKAKEATNGISLHERDIRVDYSVTKRAHSPTPGYYKGKKRYSDRYGGPRYDRDRPPRRYERDDRDRDRDRYDR
ncbi:hypothetical protein BKA69DRAFT_455489 [Paraphysoderma sedebokerense]|nr:hypothetical protein BKA69DRAFT_455489 [Paraphysoderma sedebokerense]